MNEPSIISDLKHLPDWQDRYQTIIEFGQQLEPFPDHWRTAEHFVKGCMSQVWLAAEEKDGRFAFYGDSDALIVKGLVALVIAVCNHKTRAELQQTDIEKIFTSIHLSEHLSPTRRNGFAALVGRIKQLTR
ncbi:MAG: SufE family protein [Alphaproteobacteria bacterium]|nr:SufE family protein [Alphaproteobacteria bacterium]